MQTDIGQIQLRYSAMVTAINIAKMYLSLLNV